MSAYYVIDFFFPPDAWDISATKTDLKKKKYHSVTIECEKQILFNHSFEKKKILSLISAFSLDKPLYIKLSPCLWGADILIKETENK